MFRCMCFPKSIKKLLSLPKVAVEIELEQFVNCPANRTIVSENFVMTQHPEPEFYSAPLCFLENLGAKDAYVPQVGTIESL